MSVFWKLMEQSVITSGLIAVMLAGTICYCAIAQIPCPIYVTTAFGVVIGFFFGAKTQRASLVS